MTGSTTSPEPSISVQHLFEEAKDDPRIAGTFKPYLVITLEKLKELVHARVYKALLKEAGHVE